MDPAKETPIHFALKLQGVLLGRHEVELAAVRHAVEILSAQVTELTSQLQDLRPTQSALQQPRNLPEPRINNRPCYSGQPTECRAFLTQCEVIFFPPTHDLCRRPLQGSFFAFSPDWAGTRLGKQLCGSLRPAAVNCFLLLRRR